MVSQLLKPDWRKFLLFALFLAIAMAGKIQAWAFSDADISTKPPLYDLLSPFPFWVIWMYLLLPLALIVLPLRFVGIEVMAGPPWLFIVANLLYFYLLACLFIFAYDWVKGKFKEVRNP